MASKETSYNGGVRPELLEAAIKQLLLKMGLQLPRLLAGHQKAKEVINEFRNQGL